MVTINISQWDETICNMVACQHPPCWEAMRRIEQGQPRILLKTFRSLDRPFPDTEDELPTLKIFNLPLNYKGRMKNPANSSTIISIKDSRNYSTDSTVIEGFVPTISVLSSERNHFPGLNSRVESQNTPHYTPISVTSVKQADKVTGLSEFTAPKLAYQPACGNLIVKWIPNIRHRFLQHEKLPTGTCTASQTMCVKDLALEILQSFSNSKETHFPKPQKIKKSNKVPTGGQPYHLHLRRNPKIPPKKASSPTSKERKPVECPARKRTFLPQYLQLSPLETVQRKNAAHLENKKNLLRSSKEKEASPLIVQKVPVRERGLGSIQSQLKVALKGYRVPAHLVSTLAQRPNSRTVTWQTLEAHGQRKGGGHLPQEASAEKVRLPERSPWTSQGAINRRKPSLKFVEYKSNTASLYMEGYGSCVHQISKSESKYKEYCKQIAIRKEAALIQGDPSTENPEPWIRETPQRSEENILQSFSPPPPPPSPFIS